ncbi:MAG: glycosyltransferase family 4 protein [Bdellovibrionales bacterium]|nr:glycosyltransferase family 4 protein [Bdellovibrionales bacterium]
MIQAKPILQFVVPHFGRKTGGVGVSAERIAGFLRRDFDLQVFVHDRTLSYWSVRREIVGPGLELISHNGGRDLKEVLQFQVDTQLSISQGRKPAAVCGFYLDPYCFSACLASKLMRKPFYSFARGNDLDLDIFGDRYAQIKETVESSKAIFAVSVEMRQKIESLFPSSHVRTVLNSIDPTVFPVQPGPYKPGCKPVLGLLGDLKQKKGLDFLLTHFSYEDYDLELMGELREGCDRVLHGYLQLNPKAQGSVRHRRFSNDTKALRDFFASVDILVIPSYLEGLPNVLLEGLASGKVVVASRVGGMPDVITHGVNGFLFEPRNAASFNEALFQAKSLVESGEDDLPKAARQTVEGQFHWRREKEEYLRAFSGLARESQFYQQSLQI